MASLDVFNNDAFSITTLSESLQKREYLPTTLGNLGMFQVRRLRTLTGYVERKEGMLSIIPTSERGADPEVLERNTRNAVPFTTVRLAKARRINASELVDVRAYGSESELAQTQQMVAEIQQELNDDLELTMERMRMGAVRGVVIDADDTVIEDWYDRFNIKRPSTISLKKTLDPNATGYEGDDALMKKLNNIHRDMKRSLASLYIPGQTRFHVLVGDEIWDLLTSHPAVHSTYLNWQAAADLRGEVQAPFNQFRFGGFTWENYQGTSDLEGNTDDRVQVKPDEARFFPVGARNMFRVAYSPGESFDWIQRPGQRVYSQIVRDQQRNFWVDVEVFSYPMHICQRPEGLREGKL